MKELLLTYIAIEQFREAYDYLTTEYLTTYVRHDSTIIQTYGGLIALQLAKATGANQPNYSQSYQSHSRDVLHLDKNHLRNAKMHFETALRHDADNTVAKSFLRKIKPHLYQHGLQAPIDDSDNETETSSPPSNNDPKKPTSKQGSRKQTKDTPTDSDSDFENSSRVQSNEKRPPPRGPTSDDGLSTAMHSRAPSSTRSHSHDQSDGDIHIIGQSSEPDEDDDSDEDDRSEDGGGYIPLYG